MGNNFTVGYHGAGEHQKCPECRRIISIRHLNDMSMEITQMLSVNDRDAWRTWLLKNQDKEKEIWLVFYKKRTGKQTISLTEAIDEAICFGWIDSVQKKVDDERYTLRFTPRRPNSLWSKRTIERAKRLIAEGKMTKSGLETLPPESE